MIVTFLSATTDTSVCLSLKVYHVADNLLFVNSVGLFCYLYCKNRWALPLSVTKVY